MTHSCDHCQDKPAKEGETANAENNAYHHLLKQALAAGIPGLLLMIIGFMPIIPALETTAGYVTGILLGFITLGILLYAAGDIYLAAYQSFIAHVANMDTLIALGTGVAWVFSMFETSAF